MQLTPDIVRHIARLARLTLTDAEVEKFTNQLGSIIGHIDLLAEVDTTGVPETNQVTGLSAVSRPDVVVDFPHRDELIACSKNPIEHNQIKVKKAI